MLKKKIIKTHANHTNDTGSTQVQVSLLSSRVAQLTKHLNNHKNDYSSQRGLKKILGQRKRLLKYLFVKDPLGYNNLIIQLGIRPGKSLIN
nr:ribosomal protein S15 [Mesostigma viride]